MKTLSLLLFLLVSTIALAQDYSDVIYLNDGSILKGKIIGRLDDGAIKMQMNNGREIIVSMKEVKVVNIGGLGTNVVDYGGTKAVGISILGEGVVGLHYRFKVADETWGDASVQPDFVGLENQYTDKVRVSGGFGLGGEINHYLSRRFKESKQKVRANGIFFRVYHGFNEFSTTVISAGWSSEYFKLNYALQNRRILPKAVGLPSISS